MSEVQTISQSRTEVSQLNGAQLQARFEEKEESLKQHLEGLTEELRGAFGDGEQAFLGNPSRVIAAVAVGAVAAGLFIGWKKRNAQADEGDGLAGLLDGYSHAFAEEVSEWIDKGKSVGEAVAHALKGARPVIYFEPPPERGEVESSRSKVKKTAGSLAKAAFGYALRAALVEVSNTVAGRQRR